MRTKAYSSMLEKGLSLIDILAEAGEPVGLAELARRLDLPRTSLYRLVRPLEERGYLRRVSPGSRYALSLRFLELGELVREGLELRRLAYPFMERLRNEAELAVHLVVQDGDHAVYLEKVESHRPVRLFTQVGRRVPLHVAACPRLLLSYRSDADIAAYFTRATFTKFTPNTITDVNELWRLVKETRISGFSTGYGELEPETAAVAVPVCNHRGEVVAALSLAGPEWQFRAEDLMKLVSVLQRTAQEISNELGFRGVPQQTVVLRR